MEKRRFWILALMIGCGALSSCATPQAYHSGRRGLFERLAQSGDSQPRKHWANRYSAIEEEEAPDPKRSPSEEIARLPAGPGDPKIAQVKLKTTQWNWPLTRMQVTSAFGDRGSSFHEGVDLAAATGTPIFAVDSGKVVFSGSKIRGYGKMVILKHPRSGLMTVYAHLSKAMVKAGQSIKRGQKIALSGQTGRASGPHLHFEVRKGVVAYDPIQVMSHARHGMQLARRE